MEFFSLSADDAAAAVEDFGLDDEEELEMAPEQWFEPEEGLASVRALTRSLEEHPEALSNTEAVLQDLRAFDLVLTAAQDRGLKWHLGIDY